MDGAGRFARSLIAQLARAADDAYLAVSRHVAVGRRKRAAARQAALAAPLSRPHALAMWGRRVFVRIVNLRAPRGAGLAATLSLFLVALLYGVERGRHWPVVHAGMLAVGDDLANAAGMQVRAVRLSGARQLSPEAVLAAAGVRDETSVLFFDPDAARRRLKSNPWVADATVQKLYPDQLLIAITEREPYALWQRDGKIAVIARDGAVILDRPDERFQNLPLVVGRGAEARASEIVDALAERPELADKVRAAILVAERRWTLVLHNGTDVRLPDFGLDAALARLGRLDAERRLLTRDLTMIDLRAPDRVTVRLSDDAHRTHEAAVKERQRLRTRRGGAA